MTLAWLGLVPAVLIMAATFSATAEPVETPAGTPLTIANDGGAREGHTPTAFAGMGTGLFAGDDLNPGFPEGVGVQAYLTFVLPDDVEVGTAHVVSEALAISGTPFEDLGPLLIEPVAYEAFGPDLFDLEPTGPHTDCIVATETSVRCDVTEALSAAVSIGRAEAQFRIRFAQPADGDGLQDLAMFFRANSNTNEAGLFELVIMQGQPAS